MMLFDPCFDCCVIDMFSWYFPLVSVICYLMFKKEDIVEAIKSGSKHILITNLYVS